MLVLTLIGLEHLLPVARHRGIFTAQSLNLALQLRNLASLRFDALETLILGVNLTLVDGHPFLIDALSVHQGIGRNLGLVPRLGCLFDHGFRPQDIHGRSLDRDTTESE